ncbi:GNAT family N-acetyltransferase [Abyssisolibacter fermentans]|uniref:GNAT family N-acetyltransferase n=1 Tax=Abyssisolibacter fermentans TaxID=1766203 RepID=UPI000833C882|nr:GNAT family N-acetyltransferase [Abyssisolibacter fermentans]
MLELKNGKIDFIKPLLNVDNNHFPLLKSILSGKKKGRVYVNSLEKLSVAAIISEDGWFYLLGTENDEHFNNNLDNFIVQKTIKQKKPLLWFGISQSWKKRLETYELLRIGEFPRVQYEFNYDKYIINSFAIPTYLLESINKENVNKVFESDEEIEGFWGTEENFMKYGFGFILLDKGNIVGHVYSASVEDGEVEIDIQTDKSYRGKGVATYLASCLINECIKRDLIPKWDCAVSNEPSKKLAIKLGFQQIKEYPL